MRVQKKRESRKNERERVCVDKERAVVAEGAVVVGEWQRRAIGHQKKAVVLEARKLSQSA